ncbi:hypothetical protein [Pontibacter burrus]|uniref:STAS/SEC14 domain-containing protein n=1 Tax=Pontibacter burrus TaxID=2704466 RepID=A0A6B3LXK9_9BACT|nr:hypothetical protein [Pontibacter burrus]NEM98370.1 hypothetical protein [Pontibacter burrus]
MSRTELRKANGDIFFEARRLADNSYIYVNWIGRQSLESIIMGGNHLLHMLRKEACYAILNNNHEIVGPWDTGADWIAHRWAPQAKALGVKYFAHIMSYGIYGQNSFSTLQPQLEQLFEVEVFEDEGLARNWIYEKLRGQAQL